MTEKALAKIVLCYGVAQAAISATGAVCGRLMCKVTRRRNSQASCTATGLRAKPDYASPE